MFQNQMQPQRPQGASTVPWMMAVFGAAGSVFFLGLMFLIPWFSALSDPLTYLLRIGMNSGVNITFCILSAAGCVVAAIGLKQLKDMYGMQGSLQASSLFDKLSLYHFIAAGLCILGMIFIVILKGLRTTTAASVVYLFTSLTVLVFGLINFVINREWMGIVRVMNWNKDAKMLNTGYSLAFWTISALGAIGIIYSFLTMIDAKFFDGGLADAVIIICFVAFLSGFTAGILWVTAQIKMMLNVTGMGARLQMQQPYQQQPYQQPQQQYQQQPYQQQYQQPQQQYQQPQQQYQQPQQQYQQPQQQQYQQQNPYQQQPYQQPQQQQYQQPQQQQYQQPQQQQYQQQQHQQQQQQQYEEYRRQQQQRMQQQGGDSQETLPYNNK